MDATLGSTAPGADPLQPTDNAVTPGVGEPVPNSGTAPGPNDMFGPPPIANLLADLLSNAPSRQSDGFYDRSEVIPWRDQLESQIVRLSFQISSMLH